MTWLATALHVAKRVTNWYGMVCGTGGERISRHNAFRDAIFDTAASAPLKEERALLPGNNRRPADILLRHWCGGRDAALDVTITHPLNLSKMTQEQVQQPHQAMQLRLHMTAR